MGKQEEQVTHQVRYSGRVEGFGIRERCKSGDRSFSNPKRALLKAGLQELL